MQMSDRRAGVLRKAVVAVSVLLIGGTVALSTQFRTDPLVLMVAPLLPAFVVPGLFITRRQPGNSVGWVMTIVGLLFGFLMFSASITAEGVGAITPWGRWLYLATHGAWGPPIFVLLSTLPVVFPDGRLPSKRWRWVVWAGATGSVMTLVGHPFAPGELDVPPPPAQPFLAVVGEFGPLVALLGCLASLGGMIARFRRSRGSEREQLKLFTFAGLVAVTLMLANGIAIGIAGQDVPLWIQAGALAGSAAIIAVAVGVSILRHGLFDINVVISRTLLYAIIAVLISALYVGIVVGVGALVGRGGEPNIGLSIVATATAALAFQPLRARASRFADRLVYGERATPYETLARLTERMSDEFASDDLLARTALALAEGTGASVVRVWLRVGEHMQAVASHPQGAQPPPLSIEGGALPATGAHHAIPVRHQGELLGAITIDEKPGAPLGATELRLANNLASQAGLVLRNARLTAELLARLDELKASRQRLVKAQDEERRRIERDLHDGAQQMLVALKVEAGLAAQIATEDNIRQMLAQIVAHTGEAIETVRDLARGIYPPLLASDGLVTALRSQASKSPIPAEVRGSVGRHPAETEAAVYFCCLEAMQNAAKYSSASCVTVSLSDDDDLLRFEVKDDGVGFETEAVKAGSGTQNMRDRLAALDGTLEILSDPGAGTCVRGSLPVRT